MKTIQMKAPAGTFFSRLADKVHSALLSYMGCFGLKMNAVNMVSVGAVQTQITFRDGSVVNTNSSGVFACPTAFISDMLNAGCTYNSASALLLNNMSATTNPAATDDTGDGYSVGSIWFNKSQGIVWECSDATLGAAVWMGSVNGIRIATIPAASNITPFRVPMLDFRTVTGIDLTAAAQANIFGRTYTPGTTESLVTESASSNTKTDVACVDIVLPDDYKAGQNVTITAYQKITIGGGTLSAKTLDLEAFLQSDTATQGADICATAAQTMTNAGGDVAFTLTGTTLTPGAVITLKFTAVLTETAGSGVTANVGAIRVS